MSYLSGVRREEKEMARYEEIRAELGRLYVLALAAAGYEARIARLEAEAAVILHLEGL